MTANMDFEPKGVAHASLRAVLGPERGDWQVQELRPGDIDAFACALDDAMDAPGDLVLDVVTAVREDTARLLDAFVADARTISTGLHDVALVLARVPADEARHFQQMLCLTLGMSLATARGPYGRVARVEDIRMLRMAAQVLIDTRPVSTGVA